MGLICREIESRGIPTISLSSALSITEAVNPPRAAYLDFPLGHTAGRAHDRALQRRIMIDVLSALDTIQQPGEIRRLPYHWSEDDSWKDSVMRPRAGGDKSTEKHDDSRLARDTTPQYQTPADEQAAGKKGCVFLE